MLEILLVNNVLIGSYYDFKASRLRSGNKLTIRDAFPTVIIDGFNLMVPNKLPNAVGHILIKQDAQVRGAFPRSSTIL